MIRNSTLRRGKDLIIPFWYEFSFGLEADPFLFIIKHVIEILVLLRLYSLRKVFLRKSRLYYLF